MFFLSEADSYFAPLHEYSQHSKMFVQKILSEHKSEDIYKAYQREHQNLQFLWTFLAENRIADLGIEEVRVRWDTIDNPIIEYSELEVKE